MKRVLHIINGEFFAGAERVQDTLALRLPEFGFECGFLCLKQGEFERQRRSVVPLATLAMRSRFDLSIVAAAIGLARAGGYEIVHTHTARSALIGRVVARRLGMPMLHHVHSPTLRDTESRLRNVVNSLVEDRLVLPAATRLLAVSTSLRDYLRERGVPDSRIRVVHNGVAEMPGSEDWQMPKGEWVIGTMALFRPRKGIETLLKAMRMLLDANLKVRLRVVGGFETAEYERSVRDLAHKLALDDAVDWVGFCRDVHAELRQMHVFAVPSHFGEGLPMVLIEAMSLGLPVVASRVEGIPEVLGASSAGLLVEPGNPDELARALAALVRGDVPVAELAARGRQRQREAFSDTSMTSAVADIYDNVLLASAGNAAGREQVEAAQ